MVKGTVHVHFCQENADEPLQGCLHFHGDGGEPLYCSEPFAVTDGTCVSYGPVSSEANLEAQFGVETGKAAPKKPASEPKKEEPKKEEPKKEEKPQTQPSAPRQPGQPARK